MENKIRKISDKNRSAAYLHFFPEYNGKCKPGWVLHHKDTSLKENDIQRYISWNIDDLVPMLRGDHIALHNSCRDISDDTRNKISIKAKSRDHSI